MQQHIVGLDIEVCDPLRMESLECSAHLCSISDKSSAVQGYLQGPSDTLTLLLHQLLAQALHVNLHI